MAVLNTQHKNLPRVICPYCKERAVLRDSSVVYRRSYGPIWICFDCDAYVGVHQDSKNYLPLGTLADAETRKWRERAHDTFDPLWQRKMEQESISKSQARKLGYKWLAGQLNISVKKCHIAMFDMEQCQKVVEICQPYTDKLGPRR